MENILEVRNLSKELGDFSLKNINFSIPRGRIMGLIGENGSGKTTTIKTLLNIIRKDSGSVEIFGLDMDEEEVKIKEDIAVIFDDLNFQESFNAGDVSMILKNIFKNWDQDKFFDYVDKFKIPREKIIKEYSKGMKMKLSIAIGLSHQAKLLILDEPTAGLDPVIRVEILDELLEFMDNEEHGIIFSTHITSDLDKIADYITLIHKGEIMFSQDKETILNDYGMIKCGEEDFNRIDKSLVIGYTRNKFGVEVLSNDVASVSRQYPDLIIDRVNIEEIMYHYIKGESK